MKKILLSLLLFVTSGASIGVAADPFGSAAIEADPTFDLHFEGGTFEQLLEAITEASGERPNVILGPGTEDIALPGFTLSSVTVIQILQAIADMTHWTKEFDQLNIRLGSGIQIVAKKSERDLEESPTFVQVFQIGPFLDSFQLQDFRSRIKFHGERIGSVLLLGS